MSLRVEEAERVISALESNADSRSSYFKLNCTNLFFFFQCTTISPTPNGVVMKLNEFISVKCIELRLALSKYNVCQHKDF